MVSDLVARFMRASRNCTSSAILIPVLGLSEPTDTVVLNHVSLYVDAATFERLGSSPFIKDTLAAVRSTVVSDGRSSWSALFQFGPETYVEIFRATAERRAGTIEVAFGADTHEAFERAAQRLFADTSIRAQRRHRSRVVGTDTIPWFELVEPDSAAVHAAGLRWWLMRYDSRHNSLRWPQDPSVAGKVDRRAYLANVQQAGRVVGDLSEVTIILDAAHRSALAAQLRAIGLDVTTTDRGVEIAGDGFVLRLFGPPSGEREGFHSARAPLRAPLVAGRRVDGAFAWSVDTRNDLLIERRRRCPHRARVVTTSHGSIHACVAGDSTPVVLFESGLGEGLDAWASVVDSVRRFARTVTYDRSGVGASPPAIEAFSPGRVASTVSQLLDSLGVSGPVTLVAHSLGGAYVQAFASAFPDRVAALVLVDPTPPGFFERQRRIVGDSAFESARARTASTLRGASLEEWLSMDRSQAAAAAVRRRADGRSTVLSAGLVQTADSVVGAAVKAVWIELHAGLSVRLGARHEIVPDAPHHIQSSRPDRVVDAIRRATETRP